MNRYDRGFSSPLAIAVIFSLCIMALSFCMITAAGEKRIDSYRRTVEERKKIDSVIYRIEEKIQSLKESPSDADEYEIYSLIAAVCDYDFKVSDVSTGINKTFTAEAVLKSKSIDGYVAENGAAAFVDYGWINPKLSDRAVLEQVAKDFEGRNAFPLVNILPPLNIHTIGGDFIEAVLGLFNIKEAEKKAALIKEKLSYRIKAE